MPTGTTNFLQWNPSAANQETDTAYAGDATRVNGISTGSEFASILADKAFYQWSTFVAAFCQMLASKGYSTSDASISALAAVLANVLTNADIGSLNNILHIPFTPTPVFDCSQATKFSFGAMTGNVTSSTLINATPGQVIYISIAMDSVGGRTFAWPPNLLGAGTINPAPASYSNQVFVVLPAGDIHAFTPLVSA